MLATREAEIALALAGQLACEALNFALKRLIKEERPRRIHGKGYGMPSSHAQFVAFWSVSLALFLLLRHRPSSVAATTRARTNGSAAKGAMRRLGASVSVDGLHRPWSLPERLAVSLAAAGVAAAVACSRVYLDYHTPRQVLAGAAAGVASAAAPLKPLDVRDLANFERVSAPALSPDARKLVFAVRRPMNGGLNGGGWMRSATKSFSSLV